MKIKEKGLTGKAADLRRQSIAGTGRKGFNAFAEMAQKEKGGKKGKDDDKPKQEVYLEFLGVRIRIHEEDGGSVNPEDVPKTKGASLRFEGALEEVNFDEIKVCRAATGFLEEQMEDGLIVPEKCTQTPLKERFARVPFVKYTKGEATGLVGFDKVLSEDDIDFVKTSLKTLSGKDVSWAVPDGQ